MEIFRPANDGRAPYEQAIPDSQIVQNGNQAWLVTSWNTGRQIRIDLRKSGTKVWADGYTLGGHPASDAGSTNYTRNGTEYWASFIPLLNSKKHVVTPSSEVRAWVDSSGNFKASWHHWGKNPAPVYEEIDFDNDAGSDGWVNIAWQSGDTPPVGIKDITNGNCTSTTTPPAWPYDHNRRIRGDDDTLLEYRDSVYTANWGYYWGPQGTGHRTWHFGWGGQDIFVTFWCDGDDLKAIKTGHYAGAPPLPTPSPGAPVGMGERVIAHGASSRINLNTYFRGQGVSYQLGAPTDDDGQSGGGSGGAQSAGAQSVGAMGVRSLSVATSDQSGGGDGSSDEPDLVRASISGSTLSVTAADSGTGTVPVQVTATHYSGAQTVATAMITVAAPTPAVTEPNRCWEWPLMEPAPANNCPEAYKRISGGVLGSGDTLTVNLSDHFGGEGRTYKVLVSTGEAGTQTLSSTTDGRFSGSLSGDTLTLTGGAISEYSDLTVDVFATDSDGNVEAVWFALRLSPVRNSWIPVSTVAQLSALSYDLNGDGSSSG